MGSALDEQTRTGILEELAMRWPEEMRTQKSSAIERYMPLRLLDDMVNEELHVMTAEKGISALEAARAAVAALELDPNHATEPMTELSEQIALQYRVHSERFVLRSIVRRIVMETSNDRP